MNVTTEQIKLIHVLLPKEVLTDKITKAHFIYTITKDEARTSTKQLTFNEANNLIINLGGNAIVNTWTKFDYLKPSHRNILSLLHQLGWTKKDRYRPRPIADMDACGTWLQTKAPVKKSLMDMNSIEVSKTIIALENMVDQKNKKKLVAGTTR